MHDVPEYRRRVCRIDSRLFLGLFGPGQRSWTIAHNPIPPDASVVDIRLNRWDGRDEIELIVEAPSFDPVPEGKPYPLLEITVTTGR